MHGESPEFKRCCFCLPLRRGLIGWGYFRLVLDVLAIIRFIFICSSMSFRPYYAEIILTIAVIIYYFIDAIFAVFLIVGGHKKSHGLLRISYIYNVVWLVLVLILGGLVAYSDISRLHRRGHLNPGAFQYYILDIIFDMGVIFMIIFVQVYVILLTRSEQIKLRKENLGMQFVNNAADEESRCVCTDNGAQSVQ